VISDKIGTTGLSERSFIEGLVMVNTKPEDVKTIDYRVVNSLVNYNIISEYGKIAECARSRFMEFYSTNPVRGHD
jgi:hypothetical protein